MLKRLPIVFAALIACLFAGMALADEWDEAYALFLENSTPEYIGDLNEYPIVTGNIFDDYYGYTANSAKDVGMRAWAECDKSLFVVNETSTITVTATGGTPAYRMTYMPYRKAMDADASKAFFSFGIYNKVFDGSFSIRPASPYRYMIVVKVVDAAGNYITFYTSKFETVYSSDFDNPATLGGKIRAVVNEVITPGMSDYDKALALHDWVIYNGTYDYSGTWYDPEGILLHGTGVCESYARAYQLLLSDAGVRCIYVSSLSMDHCWNLVWMGNGWYHVDCTWDDPNYGGYERRKYFCLTDAEMAEDHEWSEYDNADMIVPDSGPGYVPSEPETPEEPEVPEEPAREYDIAMGENELSVISERQSLFTFTAPYEGSYVFRFETGSRVRYTGLTEIGEVFFSQTWNSIELKCDLTSGMVIRFILTNDEPGETGVTLKIAAMRAEAQELRLPGFMRNVGSGAFEGSAAEVVIIPMSCQVIASRAFADCPNLVEVRFEGDIPEIAPDAFEGCSGIVFWSADGVPMTL